MTKNFRDHLAALEKRGLLRRVSQAVDVKFEIAAGIRKISDNNGPALLYENVKGYPGWKVVGGVYGTQRLMAAALGVANTEEALLQRYLKFDTRSVKPKSVSTGPVKEVILKGDKIDLTKLPVPTYCIADGGPFITAGVEIARHPDTGARNVSIHRRAILSKNTTSLLARGAQHLGTIISTAHAQGKRVGVATVLGVEPAVTFASQIRTRLGGDELEIAGAIKGKAIELVKCETIDVEVPADAEMVIEGVTTGEMVPDGPFGEYPGNYVSMTGNPTTEAPIVKVTAITMRKDPIFHAMLTGMPMTENHYLKKWALAANVYRMVESLLLSAEDIKGINVTAGGAAGHHIVIAINKKGEKEGRDIVTGLLSFPRSSITKVIVVDDDIDIYDPVDVEWATCTRMQPDKNVIIFPTIPQPSANQVTAPLNTEKWGIDATLPLGKNRQWYVRALPPGVDKVDFV